MITHTAQERRQYKRIKKDFVARFRLKSDELSMHNSESWEMVTTQNLCAGGVLLNYNREVPIGSLIDMFINFPQIKNPINCTGKVIRIDRDSSLSPLKVAAYFVDINAEDKYAINKAVEEFYSKKLGYIEP